MPSDLLSTREVCERLKVSPATISRKVAAGELTPVKKLDGVRGAMFFDVADIDAIIDLTGDAA